VAFVSDYESILGSDNVSGGGQGTGDLFNAGAATVQGLELNMGYEFSDVHLSVGSFSVPINLSYTYTDARFDQTFKGGGGDWGSGVINQGDVIPFITPHQLSLQCGVSTGDVQLLCTGRYTGATATKPGRGSLIIPGEGTSYTSVNALAATMFVDATCNVGIAGGVVLSGSVTNVGNSSAIVANLPQGYRPSMPRALNLGVKWTFL
jgi:Fe(3+) dicitrate transport protein